MKLVLKKSLFLIKSILIIIYVGYCSNVLNLEASINVKITKQKTNHDVFLKSRIEHLITRKNNLLILDLNLYSVDVKIYSQDKLISFDRYDKYRKVFYYEIHKNSIYDKNEEDQNIWAFIKPILLLKYLIKADKNFNSIKIINPKTTLVFEKKYFDTYSMFETYKNKTFSEGQVKFSSYISFYLQTELSNFPESNFQSKSSIKAKIY